MFRQIGLVLTFRHIEAEPEEISQKVSALNLTKEQHKLLQHWANREINFSYAGKRPRRDSQ